LPEMGECLACGATLNGDKAYYHVLADGLMCSQHKRLASSQLAPESRALAAQMFRAPVESFTEPRTTDSATDDTVMRGRLGAAQHSDLRKFLTQIIERHIEKKLVTASMLAKL